MNSPEQQNSSNPSARQCAAEIFSQVLDERRPLDETFARHAAFAQLADRDRNFTRHLVMTGLRRMGQIDALLALMLEKPLTGKSNAVMHCLRLGVVQLLFLETPAHAAVHSMVETVAALGHPNMKGLVNAVLKRVAREGAAILSTQDEVTLNVPSWLYESWRKTYGETMARTIGQVCLSEPPLDITVKDNAAQWAQTLGGTLLATGSVRLTQGGKVTALPGYDEGAWWVQDAAAALPVKLLGDVRGKTVFDLCAAPGGKTAQLAAAGAHVTAVDQSGRRLRILQANMERLALTVQTVEADVLHWKPEVTPDMIVLDAPCSATGTLRRHPEIARHKTMADVEELAQKQKRLLGRISRWLQPGGKLLYCVCSLAPEEGENQAADFLAGHPEFRRDSQQDNMLPGLDGELGVIRTHPGLMADCGGMDGFYAICFIRLNNP